MGSQGCVARQWLANQVGEVVAGRASSPTFVCGQTGRTTREWGRPCNPGFQWPMVVAPVEKTAALSEESIWGAHGILEHTQANPLRESAPGQQLEGRQLLAGSGEVTESGVRGERLALFPLWPLSHIQSHNAAKWVAQPWQIPKALPLTM